MNKEALIEFLEDSGTVDCRTAERTQQVCKIMAEMFDCQIGAGYAGQFGRFTFPVYTGRSIEGNSSDRGYPTISYDAFIEAYMSDLTVDADINAMDVL